MFAREELDFLDDDLGPPLLLVYDGEAQPEERLERALPTSRGSLEP